jgi:DNA-dependent RNA polymerase auxiliary subunit epsilon
METIIIHAEPEKIKALKAFLKAFKIPFEVKKQKSPYNPEFVNKIMESEAEYEKGNKKRISTDEELKSFLLDE